MARRGGYKLLFFLYLVNTKGTSFVFTDNSVLPAALTMSSDEFSNLVLAKNTQKKQMTPKIPCL